MQNRRVTIHVTHFDGKAFWFSHGSVAYRGLPGNIWSSLLLALYMLESDFATDAWHMERLGIQFERAKRPKVIQRIQRFLRKLGSCEDEILKEKRH